jgi:orotidine-5'-phosphate decarboxylase
MTTHDEQRTTNKLIVALDVSTAKEAREIFAELRDTGVAFKIGLQLFTAAGGAFVRELTETGARIFLDLKFHDIPNTVASAGAEAARLGAWMFNVHAAGGAEMMERTVAAVRETCVRERLQQPKIIAVTVLTSANAATLRETGVESEPQNQVLRLAQLTKKAGLDGVVASPLETGAIREVIADSVFLIVTPGVRFDRAIADDDQKRVLTLVEAVRAGANYLVVGRPILQSSDRRKTAQEICAQIESAEND